MKAVFKITNKQIMNNEIKIFEKEEFGQIRVAGTSEEPLFCAADICKALGYSNGRKAIADHCDEGDVTKRDTPTKGGLQSISYVTESGFYDVRFTATPQKLDELLSNPTSSSNLRPS